MMLFAADESLSPMEEWRRRHGIILSKTGRNWLATRETGEGPFATTLITALAPTPEQALLNWADRARVKCWKVEQIEKSRLPIPH